jgi:hypothetical protein
VREISPFILEKPSDSTMSSNAYVYSRNEDPFGISWEEWTIRWWKWILSTPTESNPVNVKSWTSPKEYNHSVILLPGNLGGKSICKFKVPGGRSILFPIINFITSFNEEPELKDDLELEWRAIRDIDDITTKEASIDGKQVVGVDDFRVSLKPFDLELIENNIFNVRSGPTRAAADGYWLFLRPLTKGVHSVRTIGSCSAGKTCVDLTFEIVVS